MFKLKRGDTALVLVDFQEKLAAAMDTLFLEETLAYTIKLVKGFNILDIPIYFTQQYTKGLGETVAPLSEFLSNSCVEKLTFSCCGVPEFKERLQKNCIKNVVIAGMEAHICVLQTVLDLIDLGFNVHVASDAVISRYKKDYDIALSLVRQAGAAVSCVETILFQLLEKAGGEEFKAISKLIR